MEHPFCVTRLNLVRFILTRVEGGQFRLPSSGARSQSEPGARFLIRPPCGRIKDRNPRGNLNQTRAGGGRCRGHGGRSGTQRDAAGRCGEGGMAGGAPPDLITRRDPCTSERYSRGMLRFLDSRRESRPGAAFSSPSRITVWCCVLEILAGSETPVHVLIRSFGTGVADDMRSGGPPPPCPPPPPATGSPQRGAAFVCCVRLIRAQPACKTAFVLF